LGDFEPDRLVVEADRAAPDAGEAGAEASKPSNAVLNDRVIYIPDPPPDSGFVITAYDLGPKALKALRRRRRRKK